MPRKASANSDSRSKWRKRKRAANPSPSKHAGDNSDDSDSAAAANGDDDAPRSASANGGGGTLARAGGSGGGDDDLTLDLREAEVLSSAEPISSFPAAVRRNVGRPHPSVLAIIAAERAAAGASGASAAPASVPVLENISHGQLQVRSAMLRDHPSLSNDPDKPSTYVSTPPPLMEGRGVPKQFYGKLHIVPRHSDWFEPTTAHRLERQVVPQYFSGKSQGHTPEKYMMMRNKVIAKYLERPEKRLVFADCQGLVSSTGELYDLSRILRFLESWGIINYLAVGSVHRGPRMTASLIKEEPTGELQLVSAPMKSIDGLILFDRSKCSIPAKDIAPVVSTSSTPVVENGDADPADLDDRILEHLSETSCNFCSKALTNLRYESQKEADVTLCSDCFHDARFVIGHSSLDFQRVDEENEGSHTDIDRWTDQETLLLLEGIEKFNDNWNNIAEHVGTKSKAQCIHHFISLPVVDGWLEKIEVQEASAASRMENNGFLHSDFNGSMSGHFPQSSQPENQIPFIDSANPVMSLVSVLFIKDVLQVAFVASAVGPRIAASCANAALSVLTRDDSSGNKVQTFCNQEEREIQRLAATIINHQLKRLELKLKEFAEALSTLSAISQGDLRRAITYLQSAARLYGSSISSSDLISVSGVIPEDVVKSLLAACRSGEFDVMNKEVSNIIADGYPVSQLISQFLDVIVSADDIPDEQKARICRKLGETDKCLVDGADEYLQLLDVASETIRALFNMPQGLKAPRSHNNSSRTCLPDQPPWSPHSRTHSGLPNLRVLRRRGRPATMPRKASANSDSRSKWRKRKRAANPSPVEARGRQLRRLRLRRGRERRRRRAPLRASANGGGGTLARAGGSGGGDDDLTLDLREAEVLSSAEPISSFPAAVRRNVGRPHPSVLAVIAAERAAAGASGASAAPASVPVLENISHGQLQVRSAMLRDHPSLSNDPDKPSTYVSTPPPLMEGRGVPKQFYGKLHIVPRHSDWFEPTTAHRLERQVVPQYFSGKSQGHTPEKYMMMRNKVIAKYLERPEKRLVFADCQGLVSSTAKDIAPVVSTSSTPVVENGDADPADLDDRILEHLSETSCNFCSKALTNVRYESQKEVGYLDAF
ncbi:hypothetical protein PR202_gb00384 [Eleusine coracana subsp. coracana]|uniref:SWI/SNF complex subunit SWI3C n=1 Tax=Eleusine coracana subsp. coracana TaxID=191504 RepID=A0AAV5DTS1_ELECO|nr:hypothetical protein PR202_gb00384 [Eleusine coracana subsp. coracana]